MINKVSVPTLELRNLTKVFNSGESVLRVLDEVSLVLNEPKVLVITGKSGSGKSTLLNIIGSLDKPSSGEVFVKDFCVTSANQRKKELYRLQKLGFIFQSHYLLKDFTALENTSLPAMAARVPKQKAFERAKALLSEVGLSERFDHFPQELSGGECQRVAVARALINDPELILADEATGNLDAQNAKMVSDLLFRLARLYKKTLLFVTHDTSLAQFADCHYELIGGKLLLCQ